MEIYWYVLIGAGIFLRMWLLPSLPIYEGSENCSPAFESKLFGQCYSLKHHPIPYVITDRNMHSNHHQNDEKEVMKMKTRIFGKKCKYGHYESKHSPQTSESNLTKDYDIKGKFPVGLGLTPTIHYDSRRDNCRICDYRKFITNK